MECGQDKCRSFTEVFEIPASRVEGWQQFIVREDGKDVHIEMNFE